VRSASAFFVGFREFCRATGGTSRSEGCLTLGANHGSANGKISVATIATDYPDAIPSLLPTVPGYPPARIHSRRSDRVKMVNQFVMKFTPVAPDPSRI
jgi:hypothetical protein